MIGQVGRVGQIGLCLVLAGCGVAVPPGTITPVTTAPTATAGASPNASPTPRRTPAPSLFPTAAFTAIGEDPVSKERAAEFQAILTDMAGDGGITATLLTADGTWSGAVGKSDGVHDMQPTSQFGIASVTKSIVAAQVMQLVEAGEVDLDRPAMDYLPADFTFDTNGATIRQLLSHRSGIPDWYGAAMEERLAADRGRVWVTDEVFALVGAARRPLGVFEYADTNYNVLGLVIEHVRQRPLVDVLRDGVLRVQGTERLIYQPDEAPTDPMAMPRGESRDALEQGGGYLPSISDASTGGAAGSIASDSISLARWWRAFCAGEIVSQAALTEMSSFDGGPFGYGLGLFSPVADWGMPGIGHSGGNFGYSSWAGCMPGEHPFVLVVLTNFWVDNLGGLPYPLVMAARSR
jgi:CubicO group peptidase (beta-lactamase class C family)